MSDDAQTAREQRREARIARRDELAELARFMSTPAGRRWLYNLLGFCHIYTSNFRTNALAMAHGEGERNVGLFVVADLAEASPDMFLQMHKEMVTNERSRKLGPEPLAESEPE